MTLALLLDVFRQDGEICTMLETPLEEYLKDRQRPAAFSQDRQFGMDLGRGYQAEWEVREDALWLAALKRPASSEPSPALAELFPGKSLPVMADWYSGELHINVGPVVALEPLGWARYARTLWLRFELGQLVEQKLYDNPSPSSLGDMMKSFGKTGG